MHVDYAVTAIMQLIPLNNSVIQHKQFPLLHRFIQVHCEHRGNLILPQYYLCCEQSSPPRWHHKIKIMAASIYHFELKIQFSL